MHEKSIKPLLEYHSFTAWLRATTIRDDPFPRTSCMRFLDSSVVTSSQLSRLILWSRTINEHLITVLHIAYLSPEVAGGFTCPAAGEVSGASGSFSRHAHPDDCRKYYICLEGIAREYGCPIGTVFKIGDADGSGACEDPEDVPGWWVETSFFFF